MECNDGDPFIIKVPMVKIVFDRDGTLLADGPADLVTRVLEGRLRVDPLTGRLVDSE